MKTSTLKSSPGLFILLSTFLFGFCLLIVQHNLFLRLQKHLEMQIRNEQNSIIIGEIIINDLQRLEANFFRLPTTSDPKSQTIFAESIHRNIVRIRQGLTVREKGWTIDLHIPLHLPESDEMVTSIHYQPAGDERYLLEIIDLLPKLVDIEQKTEELLRLAAARDRVWEDSVTSQWTAAIKEIKSFLKNSRRPASSA